VCGCVSGRFIAPLFRLGAVEPAEFSLPPRAVEADPVERDDVGVERAFMRGDE
jgi:hypothetical protein